MLDVSLLEKQPPKDITDIKTNLEILTPALQKIVIVLDRAPHKTEELKKHLAALKVLVKDIQSFLTTFSVDGDLDGQNKTMSTLMFKLHEHLVASAQNTHDRDLITTLKTFLTAVLMAMPSDRVLNHPVGLAELAWLINYRLEQVKQRAQAEPAQAGLQSLLDNMQKTLRTYQEGKMDSINAIVASIDDFLRTNPEAVSQYPWLVGIKQECLIKQKRHEANQYRQRLDNINIELMGKRNAIEVDHSRQIAALRTKYKIREQTTPKDTPRTLWQRIVRGVKSFISFFNIAKDIRKEKFLKEKLKLLEQVQSDLESATKEHKAKYQGEIATLEAGFGQLKSDVQKIDPHFIGSVVIPLSFQSHREIKMMAIQHGGFVIGGLAQNKIVSLGSSQGLCYGFTKEWLMLVNAMRSSDEITIIDRMNLFAKKSETDKDTFTNQVNNLVLNEKVYRHFNEQTADKLKTNPKYRKESPIDDTMPARLFSILDELKPPSIVMAISSTKGGAHALGIAETKDGIWFHDSNYACIYFPYHKTKDDTQKNFTAFLQTYLKTVYGHYDRMSFIPITEKMSHRKTSQLSKSRTWTQAFRDKFKVGEKHIKPKQSARIGVSRAGLRSG